jgi:hypothetical protein
MNIIIIKNMKKIENFSKGDLIKADIYSRKNAINGKYREGKLELDDLSNIKDDDIFFLETLKMRADLADKMISEAEVRGEDMNDLNMMKELGEKIKALGTPIHRNEAVMTAVLTSLQLMVYYGIAVCIWGFVFKGSFLTSVFLGLLIGLLISIFSVAPVIASQRTKEKIRDMVFGVSVLWGNIGIIIGIVGLVALIIRLVFF